MTGPIAIELVADPPAGADTSRTLVEACASAAGPPGCVLEGERAEQGEGGEAAAPRARVLVVFSEGGLRLRVQMVSSPPEGPSRPARSATFRPEDAPQERFRAAGLIVVGLVAAETAPPGTAEEAGDGRSAPAHESTTSEPVALRFGAGVGATAERPWALAQLGADVRLAGSFYLALDGGYGRTWSRDSSGIAQERLSFAVGPGVAVPVVPGRLELRARVEGEMQDLRAAVVQPSTGLEDASGRVLAGLALEADLEFPLGNGLDLFLGDRLDWWGSQTTVRVQDASVETIGGWLNVAIAGLNVRLP